MKIQNKAKLIVLLAVTGMSLSAVFVRMAYAPSVVLAFWRMCLTAVLMLPVVWIKCRKEIAGLERKNLIACVISGVFLGIHLAAYFEAVKNTTLASGLILVNTKVLFIPIVLLLVYHEKIPVKGLIAIGAAFLGTVVIAGGDQSGGSNIIYGDIMAIIGSLAISGYTLIGRTQRKYLSNMTYTFLVYGSAALVLLAVAMVQGMEVIKIMPQDYRAALGMAVCCTLLGHSLANWALKYLSAAFISVCNLGEPVMAVGFGIFLYGEIPALYQMIGSAVILSSICLYSSED